MHPIVLKNISKTFYTKNKEIHALKNVNLEVEEGEMFGFLGPNGAGKTTLINIMLNLLTPDTGSVQILGKAPSGDVLKQINVVAGGSMFHWALRPSDILKFYAQIYQVKNPLNRIQELASMFKMEHILERKFGYLSTGEKLRVAFAKSLLNEPKLLLMDEPTLGLDPDVARHVRKEVQRLNQQGTTILLTSHYMHEVEQLCNRIAFIYKGQIIDVGRVKDITRKHFGTYDVFILLDKAPSKMFLNAHKLDSRGKTIKATYSDEDELSKLLVCVHKAGYSVMDITVKKPNLEDYFIKILGQQ